jgi:hypothetical protein
MNQIKSIFNIILLNFELFNILCDIFVIIVCRQIGRFYDFDMSFWNCSDGMVFVAFHIIAENDMRF